MKYESELLNEILEQRGHEKSSLHYQSECVKSWVDEAKGGYPKLCDYESEWLNYINENPVGEFPYETVTTNNTITVNHVVPFEYKSAILKGKTDENLQSVKMPVLTTTGKNLFVKSKLNGGNFTTFNGKNVYEYLDGSTNFSYIGKFENNTQYTISLKFYRDDVNKSKQTFIVIHYSDETTTQKIISPDKLAVITSETGKTIKKITGSFGYNVSVYIDLDTTQIEKGTQVSSYEPSKTNILTVNEDVTLRSNGDICDELDLLTGKLTQRIGEDGEVLSQEVVKTVELSVVNQDEEPLSKIKPIEGTMHIEVSGTPINPTAVLEVPVEAITQNLSSFIEEE